MFCLFAFPGGKSRMKEGWYVDAYRKEYQNSLPSFLYEAGLWGAKLYLSPQMSLASSDAESWPSLLSFKLLGIGKILSWVFLLARVDRASEPIHLNPQCAEGEAEGMRKMKDWLKTNSNSASYSWCFFLGVFPGEFLLTVSITLEVCVDKTSRQ